MSDCQQYLPVTRMFEPYLNDKLYNSIMNEKDILIKLIKALYATASLHRDDFDTHRRDAGACDDDIGNSGNGNGGGDNHSGSVAPGPAGDREWINHVSIHPT